MRILFLASSHMLCVHKYVCAYSLYTDKPTHSLTHSLTKTHTHFVRTPSSRTPSSRIVPHDDGMMPGQSQQQRDFHSRIVCHPPRVSYSRVICSHNVVHGACTLVHSADTYAYTGERERVLKCMQCAQCKAHTCIQEYTRATPPHRDTSSHTTQSAGPIAHCIYSVGVWRGAH